MIHPPSPVPARHPSSHVIVQLESSGDVHVSANAEQGRNPIATTVAKNNILIRPSTRGDFDFANQRLLVPTGGLADLLVAFPFRPERYPASFRERPAVQAHFD